MIKVYSIDENYLEKFLNMIPDESVKNILVTPKGIYTVICNHDPAHAGIYSYVLRLLAGSIKPVNERVLESSGYDVLSFSSVSRKIIRTYDLGVEIPKENQEFMINCLQKLFRDKECVFLNSRTFTLTQSLV